MPKIRRMHPSEEVLEQYSMEKLPEPECAAVEEHLLVCAECQDRLSVVDAEIAAIKQACRDLPVERKPWWKFDFLTRFSAAAPMWAAAAAAVVIAIALPIYNHMAAPTGQSDVVLQASRGSAEIAEAQAGSKLQLTLDLTEVPAEGPFRMEIVNSQGEHVWSRSNIARADRVNIDGPSGLSAGNYWVRVYSPTGSLLREFGLLLK